jgi:phosphatidylglycerol:prolipoprotein diacylglycerol transferase
VRPVLTDFFGIPISSFGVFLLLAFALAIVMARRAAKEQLGIDPNALLDMGLYAIIAGIIGGRIGYVLVHLGAFIQEPSGMLRFWADGGLVFYGAVASGLFLVRWYARVWKVSFGALLDVLAGPLVVGYGIAMIGVFLDGRLFAGAPTGVPWGVELGLERRHPTALYLFLASLGMLRIVRAERGRQLVPGTLMVLVLFLQAVTRFVVDVFVDSSVPVGAAIGPLTLAQWASALVAILMLVVLVRLQRQAPPGESEAPPAEPPAETTTA